MVLGYVFVAIGVLVVSAGLAALYFGRRNRLMALASAGWPSVGGVIETNVMSSSPPRNGEGDETTYFPQIGYSYVVGGETFMGDRLGFSFRQYGDEEAAATAAAAYPVGTPVVVFYDPANPFASTLSTTAKGTLSSEIVGGIVVALGLASIAIGIGFVVAPS
jgi:hypothetical protein